MASGIWTQLRCSFWRHYLQYMRQWPWLLGIFIVAVFPFALLAGLKSAVPPETQSACYFKSRIVSSQQPLSLLQSYVCNLDNKCQQTAEDSVQDGYPGAIINILMNSTGKSQDEGKLAQFASLPLSISRLANLTRIIANPNLTTLMENGLHVKDVMRSPDEIKTILTTQHQFEPQVVDAILESKINMTRVFALIGYRDIKSVICSPEQLGQFLLAPSDAITSISTSLCGIESSEIANVSRIFVSSLDASSLFDKVSDVLKAIGGYEAESLVQDVGALLASLGRLEVLAPLATTLEALSASTAPLISALSILEEGGWNSESLTSLFGLVEELIPSEDPLTTQSELLTTQNVQKLLSPKSMTLLPGAEEISTPWYDLMKNAVQTVNKTEHQILGIAKKMENNPGLHTAVMLTTSLLPALLSPGPITFDRIGDALTVAVGRMMPEVRQELKKGLPEIQFYLHVGKLELNATRSLALWIRDIPPDVLMDILQTFANITLIKTLVEEKRFATWTCAKSSWPNMSAANWQMFDQKLCDKESIGNLKEIEVLIQPLLDSDAVKELFGAFSKSTFEDIIRELEDIWGILSESFEPLVKYETKRKKRSVIEGISGYLEEIPAGDSGTIQGIEHSITHTKRLLQYITKICITYVQSSLDEVEKLDVAGQIPKEVIARLRGLPVGVLSDAVASVLDSVLHFLQVVKSPWRLEDLELNEHLRNILFQVIPENALEGTSSVLELMENPTMQVPAPVPQLLGILSALEGIGSQIQGRGSFENWMQEKLPYTFEAIQKGTATVPRILAIPYLWTLSTMPDEAFSLLFNETEDWRRYPCGSISLSSFYPAGFEGDILPSSWSNLDEIKRNVREFEAYLCANGTKISQEMASFDPQLSQAVLDLVENMVPGEVNISASMMLVKSFAKTWIQTAPMVFGEVTGLASEFFDELKVSYQATSFGNDHIFRIMTDTADLILRWYGRFPSSQSSYSLIQFFMFHADAIGKSVIELLNAPPKLGKFIGLPEDYLPIVLLQKDPKGTADFLLQELTTFFISSITGDLSRDWMAEVRAMCERSVNQSSLVELACYVSSQPELPNLQSPLASALMTAVTSFQQGNIAVPPMPIRDLLMTGETLVQTVAGFSPGNITEFGRLLKLWEAIVDEAKIFYQGLEQLQMNWLFMALDYAASQYEPLFEVLSDVEVFVCWLQDRIPQTIGELFSGLPPSLKQIHDTLNSSFVDIMDGLHFYVTTYPELITMSLSDVCSSTSSFQAPEDTITLDDVCSTLSSVDVEELKEWLQYDQLVQEMKKDIPSFSSQNTSSCLEVTISRLRKLIYLTFFNSSQSISPMAALTQKLPMYLQEEQWNKILQTISSRDPNSTFSDVIAVAEVALVWVTNDDDKARSSLLRMISLHQAFEEYLSAPTLLDMLKDYPSLRNLTETITVYVPKAMKDLVGMISKSPEEVGTLIQTWLGDMSPENLDLSTLCQMDLQSMGQDFQATITRLCDVNVEDIAKDIGGFFKIELFQQEYAAEETEESLESNLKALFQLQQQLQTGAFLQKFTDPGVYLGLDIWRDVPRLVFNVSSDTMWDNSTMIIARLLEPIVSYSRTPEGAKTKELLLLLDQTLRSVRLTMALAQGGDLWKALREAYVDKPVINELFDTIEILPQFLLEYMDFFGNYSVISQALFFRSDTLCNFHLFLLDGNRDHLSNHSSAVLLDVFEFVCNYQQISMILQQLVPNTPPVIANITMELDPAMLANLLDSVAWDVMYIIEGNFFEGPLQIPSWAEEYRWQQILGRFNMFSAMPPKEFIILAAGLGLDTARSNLGDQYIVPAVGAAYQISKAFSDNIDETTGKIDFDGMFRGWPKMDAIQKKVFSMYQDLVALAFWFPESKAYYYLMTGSNPEDVYNHMCSEGVDEWLLHPYLTADQWQTVHDLLCPTDPISLEDLAVVANASEIMNGMTIDWLKVGLTLEEALMKLPSVKLPIFYQPWANDYYENFQKLTQIQRITRGVLSGTWFLQLFGTTPEEKHRLATFYIQALAALQPLTSHDENLYVRLANLDSFKELLEEYANVMEDIVNGTSLLRHKYQLSLAPGVVSDWPPEAAAEAYRKAMSNVSHYELLRDFKVAILNLTDVIFPEGDSVRFSFEDFVANVTTNVLLSMPELLQIMEAPVCELYSGIQWKHTIQLTGKAMQMASKHVGQWHGYVRFICLMPSLDIVEIIKGLEDFGLKEDINEIMREEYFLDESLDCPFAFSQAQVLQNQVTAVIKDYIQNKTAGPELLSCLEKVVNSTLGLQFRGLLEAIGQLLQYRNETRDDIIAGLIEAVESIPGASSALQSLVTRINVLVPARQIFSQNYEAAYADLPEVLMLFKNDFLLVDVNRVYQTDASKFAQHLTPKSKLRKVFKEAYKSPTSSSLRKREVAPLDLLDEVISSMGPSSFADKFLETVNETYIDEEIDRMRMDALLTSESGLMPIMEHMDDAMASLSKLSELEAVLDLNKIITGEVDPVSFLSGTMQMMQIRLWKNLAESFLGILETSAPLIAGSELEDDMNNVIDGINSLQNIIDVAIIDFSIPMTSLIFDREDVEKYLKDTLDMDASVIEALMNTELNIMEVLSLQDVSVEELVCGGKDIETIVKLPSMSNVSLGDISHSLCNVSDAEGLVSVFLSHLDIGPLIATLTRFGLNTTVSSYGMSWSQVIDDIVNLEQSVSSIPELVKMMQSLQDAFEPQESPQEEKTNETNLDEFVSPAFLQRAGNLLCGEPLRLIPDSMGLLDIRSKKKSEETSTESTDFCKTLEKDIKQLPGGQILLYFIKPLIQGKIFYSPENDVTNEIIRQANSTFSYAANQRQLMYSLEELAHKLTSPEGRSDLQSLENAFKTPWLKDMLLDMFPEEKTSVLSEEEMLEVTPRMDELANLTKEMSDILGLGVNLLSCFDFHRFVPVASEEEMIRRAEEAAATNEFLAGIVFENVDGTGDSDTFTLPKEITYAIRVDNTKTPSTSSLGPKSWRPGPYTNEAVPMRYHQGFLLLQQMIDQAIIQLQYITRVGDMPETLKLTRTSSSTTRLASSLWPADHEDGIFTSYTSLAQSRRKREATLPEAVNVSSAQEADMIMNLPVYTKQEPYPCYEKDQFMSMVSDSPVISLILSFVTFTLLMVFLIQLLVQERKARNKQLEEIMGLIVWLDHFAWYIYAAVLVLLILLILTLITTFGGIQPKTSYLVFLAFMYCYGLSLVLYCYLVSCIVMEPVMAVFIGVMSLLVFNVPFITISVIQARVPFIGIVLSCLLPPSAFGFGFRIICQYELLGIGANYANLYIPPLKGTDMTLGLTITMLCVDCVIFYTLALIATALRNGPLQHVCSRKTSQMSSYPEMTSYPNWQGYGSYKKSYDFTFNIFQEQNIQVLDVDPGVKQSLQKGLSISGLRRVYHQRGRSKVAVHNLSLELYEGQILALLGHNGAGKTTIISAITREIEATSGSIHVYGNNIKTSWNKARSLIGLCPQESVLFPLMTVREILLYFTILKGTPREQADAEVNTVMVDMGLFNHRQYLGRQLSGGMRRRLCLALAFVGNSKLVILDEPTSGVDPAARSAIWEVISNNRNGRTILFTTHHLDEAETLADRVAILQQGQLLCVGSPLALKSEYGSGYSVTLSNRQDLFVSDIEEIKEKLFLKKQDLKVSEGTFTNPNSDAVLKLVQIHVPNAKLLETVNGERTYSLPLTNTNGDENKISEMFGELENRLEDLGFSTLEVRPTSLEDVVIALDTINNIDNGSYTSKSRTKAIAAHHTEMEEAAGKGAYDFKPGRPLQGASLTMQRLKAILYKRLMSHGRSWSFYVQMFVLPLVFIVLAMLGSLIRPMFEGIKPLDLKAEKYDPSIAYIRTLDDSVVGLATSVTGEGKWKTCPSTFGRAIEAEFSCNSSLKAEDVSCLCKNGMCWMDISNLSSVDDWLMSTKGKYLHKRYSGLTLDTENLQPTATVWYDNSMYHTLPAYISLFNNARLKKLVGKYFSIDTINHPIKVTKNSLSSMSTEQHIADLGIGLLILVSLTIVASTTGGYVVAERVRGERTVMYVAGISRNVYWTAHMLWDILVITLNVLLTAVVLLIFNQQQFLYRDNLAAFVLLAFLYGLSMLPLFYLVEGTFKSEASAVLVFFSTSFAIGLIASLIVITCQFYSYVVDLDYDIIFKVVTFKEMEGILKYLFLIFPPFTFAFGVKDIATSYAKTAILAGFNIDVYMTPFSWDPKLQGGLGLHYLLLALWAIIGTTVLHTWRKCQKRLPQKSNSSRSMAGAEEDKDVAAERIKIQTGGASLYDTVLRIVGLGKDFTSPPSVAVSNLFLALKRGECFSLLGLNGAGKTTTFRCVTGEFRPTRGEILINGLLLEEALAQPHPTMGYCPQSESLDPNLTPREALTVMALIRGFPASERSHVLRRALVQMGLLPDHNTYISQLSGGTKRKISTALALLGNPVLVLLDEPTTGLDPSSRRGIWSAIKSVTEDGRTVLLTSHSMDEVNVLSHRMAIMVNGYFVCMGSPHYLKNKFGDKYTIRIKTNAIEDMTVIVDYLRSQWSDVLLKEQHHLTLVMEVSRSLSLQVIFDSLNKAKEMGVTEYDVSQTTLNEVFRLLTSHQDDGQLPPPAPVRNDSEQAGLPIHVPSVPQEPDAMRTPVRTFQRKSTPFTPVRKQTAANPERNLPSVETDRPHTNRSSFYDNVGDDQSEIYATISKPRTVRPSPDIESFKESVSSEESPDEEWTSL